MNDYRSGDAEGAAYLSRDDADHGDAPSRGEADADEAYFRGPDATARGIRCGSCKGRHGTPADVRWCYDVQAEAQAEQAAEAAAERAYAEDRERKAESGTWFGPVTDADRDAESDWSWEYQKRWGRAENE